MVKYMLSSFAGNPAARTVLLVERQKVPNSPMHAGNDKAFNKEGGVLLAVQAFEDGDFNRALNSLGAVFSRRFYPEMSEVFREQLKPVIENAFNKLTEPRDQVMFSDRLIESGLPVIPSNVSDRDVLNTLAMYNPRYEWLWPIVKDAEPQMLAVRLDEARVIEYRNKLANPKNWTMRAMIDVLTWRPSMPGEAAIVPGGVDIQFNSNSWIEMSGGNSLALHDVRLFPYATGILLSVPRPKKQMKDSMRRLVTVNRYDQIVHGLRNIR